MSKLWNNVASPYLLRKLKLFFKQDSFNRLLDISNHPFFSKLVTGLVYEPNVLRESDRASWELKLDYLCFMDDNPSPAGTELTVRDLRTIWRNHREEISIRQPYSKVQLDKAWSMYKQFFQEQEDLRERDHGAAELSEAIGEFPNLREVSKNLSRALEDGRGYFTNEKINPYAQALACAGVDDWHSGPCGVYQTRSLLLAIYQLNIQLQSLRIGQVSWKFLMLESGTLKKIKKSWSPSNGSSLWSALRSMMRMQMALTLTLLLTYVSVGISLGTTHCTISS